MPTPVAPAAPRVDPDAPTAVHHVPSWAHHAPAAPVVSPAQAGRPASSPVSPEPRVQWSAAPRPVAPQSDTAQPRVSRATVPVDHAAAARLFAEHVAPGARPVAEPTAPVAVAPRVGPAPSPVAVARPIPQPTAPVAVDAPVAQRTAPVGPAAQLVAEPSSEVPTGVEAVPELAGAEHGTITRRTRRPTRTAARLGVLGVLAGITVVIPVSQGVVPGPVAFGSDALADSTLPTTVSALAGSPLSALPPSSLVSADGALQARSLSASSRTEERSLLPGCDGSVRPAGQNGLLKVADLCTLWDNHTQLRADAAVSLAEFNQAFAARFGGDLCLSSGYRTLAQQRAVKAQKGGLAAVPGKSNHGWGLAVDLCQDQTSGVKWNWIQENGPTYGWQNPEWAQPGGSGPHERWHWEYVKGVQADGEYYDG
ncbi:MAG: D-alanyl-D-alanine carboxypeptidase family protein [Cellulomonas sp.]